MEDERIAELLVVDQPPEAVAAALTAEADHVGARDNVTVAVVEVGGIGTPAAGR